jgi:lipid II:glycine glycyltransferase (peptidoglycan interpeptide bridge formation enzyme)
MTIVDTHTWEQFLADYPDTHLLQTAAWGELKSEFGWQVVRLIEHTPKMTIGGQILLRPFLPGISLAYLPKGPVYDRCELRYPPPWEDFWQSADRVCRSRGAICLKVESDVWVKSTPTQENSDPDEIADLCNPQALNASTPPVGFAASPNTIQPRRTLVVNLRGEEEQILMRMKQKTRYNIRLGLKRGLVVRASSDVTQFHQLMTVTGQRDQFNVHSLDYYQRAHELFHGRGACELLFTEYEGQVLAGLMVFAQGPRAWYLYGASSNEHRDLMPTYLLQWEAMRWARQHGCLEYDLWGVPDADLEELEANFTSRSQDLWGVYRFKRGFGGDLRRAAGTWDRVYSPIPYALYRWRVQRGQPGGGTQGDAQDGSAQDGGE